MATDARAVLAALPYSYRTSRDGKVFVARAGRTVTTLAGPAAARLLTRLQGADDAAVQLLLAKTTGHYRHGTES